MHSALRIGGALLFALAPASELNAQEIDERPTQVAITPFDLVEQISQGSPMTAAEAAKRASDEAPSVNRAEALARVSEASVSLVRAQLWPRLDLTGRFAHVDGFPNGKIRPGGDPESLAMAQGLAEQVQDPVARALWQRSLNAPAVSIKIPRNQIALSARLTYPVSDVFLSVLPALEAARAGERASRAQRAAELSRVALSAREAFYELARARGMLAVAQRAVEQTRAQKERIDAGVAAGIRTLADASAAASRLNAAEQAVVSAETAVEVADAALRTMLQDGDGPTYAISEPLLTEPYTGTPSATDELVRRAQNTRPEVRALRESLEAQKKKLRADKGAAYPHVGVYAGGDYARPNRYVIPPNFSMQPSWEVGAQVAYAPNDTVTALRRQRESAAQLDALAADLEKLQRALELEVRRASASLKRAQRSIDAAQASETAAQKAYDQRMAQLRAGEVTTADLFAAEAELNGARMQRLDAAIELKLAEARLAYAVGD